MRYPCVAIAAENRRDGSSVKAQVLMKAYQITVGSVVLPDVEATQ
jgi:hypothetical protein